MLQGIDHFFHILGLGFVGDQQGIGRVHDDGVVDADGGHHLFVALGVDVHMGVAGVHVDPVDVVVTGHGVAIAVCGVGIGHSGPGTHIAPAELGGHQRDIGGAFHDGIVDADVGLQAKGMGFKAGDALCGARCTRFGSCCALPCLGLGAGQGVLCRTQDFGRVLGQGVEHAAGTEAEHAAVPVIAACGQIFLGCGQVGFFDKLDDGLRLATDLGHFDVAKASFGAGGLDAKDDQLALLCMAGSLQCVGHKGRGVRDQVVCSQHQHDGVSPVLLGHSQRCQGNGRRSVAAFGLQQVAHAGWLGHFGHQVLCEEQVVLVGDDEHVVCATGLAAGNGLL